MKDLTEGNPGKVILWFAIPMLLGNIFHQLYNVVDTIIVGNYIGKEALSAVGASFPIIFVLISLIFGLSSGTTIIISQYFGAKDYEKVKLSIDTMFIVLFFSSIIMTAAGMYFSEDIFRLIDLPENIIPQAKTYLNIYLGGMVVGVGFYGTSAILRGLGDSKTPLIFMIISTVLNILLDLLFVIVFKMGIAGVAIATVIAQAIAFVGAIIYLNRTHELIHFSITKMKFDSEIFKQTVRIGLPTGLQHSFVSLGMTALYKIVNAYGTDVIAAYAVALRIGSFASMPAMNFASAFSTFVGQNIGANKTYRIKNGMISTFLMTSTVSLFFTAIFIIFAHQLMGLFTPDQNVIEIGSGYLYIVSGFYVVFSTMFIFTAVFRGAGDTIIPMFITLFALWIVRIPASYFLSLKYGVTGIWWGIPTAWIVGASFAILYYLTGRWKTKTVVKYSAVKVKA